MTTGKYYRGTRKGIPFTFVSYFTKDLSEAAWYAKLYNGDVIAAEIQPRKPYICGRFCSIPELAERFKVKYRPTAEGVKKVYEEIRKRGYDSVLKEKEGDWVVVLDPSIVKETSSVSCSEAMDWLEGWIKDCVGRIGDESLCREMARVKQELIELFCKP